MAWSTLGANDWPTNNDVLDAISNAVFSLKAGQYVPSNNDWITISEANSKLNISPISGNGTDWPTKSQFESAEIYYKVCEGYSLQLNHSGDYSCFLENTSTNELYTTNPSGVFGVEDIVYEKVSENILPMDLGAWEGEEDVEASLYYVDLQTNNHNWLEVIQYIDTGSSNTWVVDLGSCGEPSTSIVIQNEIQPSATTRITQLPNDGTTIALRFENGNISHTVSIPILAVGWPISSSPIDITGLGSLQEMDIYWHDTGNSPWPALTFSFYINNSLLASGTTGLYNILSHPRHKLSLAFNPDIDFLNNDVFKITIS